MRCRCVTSAGLLVLCAYAAAPVVFGQDAEKLDPATLRKKAKQFEREGFAPPAYRAYAQLSKLDPNDWASAFSAARCACEMRAYARAKESLEHAQSLRETTATRSLARRIEAGLARDARWEALVEKELFPLLMELLENGTRDRKKVAEVFRKDQTGQSRFRSRHVELKRAGSIVALYVRTSSKEQAKRLCDHLREGIESAAKGWTADRAKGARGLFPDLEFGDAVRRADPLSVPDADTLLDIEWAFPVRNKPKKADFTTNVADLTSTICSLAFAQREVGPESRDDQALRGFSGRLYTVGFNFDGRALGPAARSD